MYFLTKTRRKQLFSIISVLIPVNEFRSVQTCRSLRDVISARIWVHCTRLFVRLRLRANGARDNANVTRRSHYQKSLLRDNDGAVFCAKLETIYVDWIALLRRLLISCKQPWQLQFIAHLIAGRHFAPKLPGSVPEKSPRWFYLMVVGLLR